MQQSSDSLGSKMILGVLWLLSLGVVGYVGFLIGQGVTETKTQSDQEVLSTLVSQTPMSPTPAIRSAASSDTPSCQKTGYAQKWEFLEPYVVKEKDTVQGIAESELGDESRANEIMQINGLPLVVGSTIYLPPSTVTKSNGYLKQVHGKLIEKNASMWHLSFNENEKGLGILIPTYWFDKISGKDSYKVGECLTILLDEGHTVFFVERQ